MAIYHFLNFHSDLVKDWICLINYLYLQNLIYKIWIYWDFLIYLCENLHTKVIPIGYLKIYHHSLNLLFLLSLLKHYYSLLLGIFTFFSCFCKSFKVLLSTLSPDLNFPHSWSRLLLFDSAAILIKFGLYSMSVGQHWVDSLTQLIARTRARKD